jgi:hypothetical protein
MTSWAKDKQKRLRRNGFEQRRQFAYRCKRNAGFLLADEEATILFISHPQWHKCVGIIREQDEITAFPKIGLSLPRFDFLTVEGMPGIVDLYRSRIMGSMS